MDVRDGRKFCPIPGSNKRFTYLPMKKEHTECSETSAYKIQTPGNYPEENIQQDFSGFQISQIGSGNYPRVDDFVSPFTTDIKS